MVFLNLQYPILFGTGVPDKEMGNKKFQEVMAWVTDFIKPTGYVAGTNHLTVGYPTVTKKITKTEFWYSTSQNIEVGA